MIRKIKSVMFKQSMIMRLYGFEKKLNELRFIIFELDLDWESRHKVFYVLFCPKNRGTVLNV